MIDFNIFKFEGSFVQNLKELSQALNIFRKKSQLADFFNDRIKSKKIHYAIYQFGLRPYLPIMDILYLEYLHCLVKKSVIDNIIIFPTIDLAFPVQGENEFQLFCNNIKKIFKGCENKITFNHPLRKDSIDNTDLTSADFLKTLIFIGSKEYFNDLEKEFGIKISNIGDFNKYHPADTRLLSIFTHIIGAWQVLKYLKEKKILDHSPIELGFIFWETEVDKLGVFKKISKDNKNVTLSIILGKSKLSKEKIPVPVYDHDYAINLFQEETENFQKINKVTKSSIEITNSILRTILSENYSLSEKQSVLAKEGKVIFDQQVVGQKIKGFNFQYPKQSYILISLLNKLRNIYNDGQSN